MGKKKLLLLSFCLSVFWGVLNAQSYNVNKLFKNYTPKEVSVFESYPSAAFTLFIDIDSLYTASKEKDRTSIVSTYFMVSEDFRPFAINVTTNDSVYKNAPIQSKIRIKLKKSTSAVPIALLQDNEGEYYDCPLGTNATQQIAAILGIQKDVQAGIKYSKYCGSIMAGNFAWYSLFSQNEINQLAQKYFFRTDQVGDDFSHAKKLVLNVDSVLAQNNNGVIEKDSDIDIYSFQFNRKGRVDLLINPLKYYNNLHIHADVYDAQGNIVITGINIRHYDVSDCVDSCFTETEKEYYEKGWLTLAKQAVLLQGELGEGEYYIKITSADLEDAQKVFYSAASALGYYEISGDLGYLIPTARFEVPEQICLDASIVFANTSRGSECNFKWTFEGANISSSTLMEPEVKYSKSGKYLITLEASNDSAVSVFTDTIAVYDIPLKFTIGKQMMNDNISIQFKDPSYLVLADFYRDDLEVVDSNTYGVDVCLANDCYNFSVTEPFKYVAADCGLSEWSKKMAYYWGDTVAYNGMVFFANYWSSNTKPVDGTWLYGPWTFLYNCVAKDTSSGFKLFSPVDNKEYVSVSPKQLSAAANNSEFASSSLCIIYPSDTTKEKMIQSEAIVYPNPAREKITITNLKLEGGEGVEIYNTSGMLVYTYQPLISKEINVSDLSYGLYFVKVYLKSGETKTAKFVKF